ncbi:flavodoxin domain-containing protein, partial [Streptomyces rochei]
MEPVNVAVIYYSTSGNVHALARAVVEGARKAGAHVRLRKVAETAPAEVVDAHPAWARHHRDTAEVA